jgi:hypothetical protein
MHLSTTSLLLLPLLASSSLALPSPKRHARGLFRRIREREFAGTGVYANFVAEAPSADSSSASSSDTSAASDSASSNSDPSASSSSYVIAVASASPAEDYLPASSSIGKDTVQPSTVDLSSQSLSSLLAQTSAYNSFSYTNYVASSTSAPAVLATGSGSGSGNVYADAISAAEAYVQSMMQNAMPTITLEIVMEPTQVS